MKTLILTCLLAISGYSVVLAQFNSGSNGSYGAINVTANTALTMPDDGIFHCTTIDVATGVTLGFVKNARNTPVYLLATGDVTIAGTIDVSGGHGSSAAGGTGGPGGFNGKSPGFSPDQLGGSGLGPGGGKPGDAAGIAGCGAYQTVPQFVSTKHGEIYGSRLLIPLIGGSGAGGTFANGDFFLRKGGGGGGAILLASNTRITIPTGGAIKSQGGLGPFTSIGAYVGAVGSGGAIRLVAPQVSGAGSLNAYNQVFGTNILGSQGRTRIDTLNRTTLAIAADSVGGVMFVFPQPLPKLSVTNAAGTAIAEGATAEVNLFLPSGTSPNQTVTVRARDFGQSVPIRVALLPDSGDPITYEATIDNTATNPAETTVNVIVPVNKQVRVQVWTR